MKCIACLLVVLAACKGSGPLGKERSDCRADATCDPGLVCLSNLCVRPPPAACTAVAELLTSFDLGNYAEPEDRAPVVAKYKARCTAAYVTKEQGQCIDKARDRWAVAECAPALFPELASSDTGNCGQLADKVKAML